MFVLCVMVCEYSFLVVDFIYFFFVYEGVEVELIVVMFGVSCWSFLVFIGEVQCVYDFGVCCIVFFFKVFEGLKIEDGVECFNVNGFILWVICQIKEVIFEMVIMIDVVFDFYFCDGYDGIVSQDGVVFNDEMIELFCKQVVVQVEVGVDLIGFSDMMDGWVGVIWEVFDDEGFEYVGIISYMVKYFFVYYGFFCEVFDFVLCVVGSKLIFKNKDMYQMDFVNVWEVIIEVQFDEQEGVDIMMVKFGLVYFDIIYCLCEELEFFIVVYNVSGEYLMVKVVVEWGWIDEKVVVLEMLLSFKCVGVDLIFIYYVCDVVVWLKEV